ncbi:MAG: hypothetical protein V1888_00905 [archaeon]
MKRLVCLVLVLSMMFFCSGSFSSPEDEWWSWGEDSGYSRYTNANGPANISDAPVIVKSFAQDVDNSVVVVGDSLFIVADSYYSSHAFELNASNISQVFQESTNNQDVLHSMSYYNGFLYYKSDYYLYQINASNLSQIIDTEYIADSAGWNGPPTVLNDKVYAAAGNYNPYTRIFNASNISQVLSQKYVYSRPYEAIAVSGDYAYSPFSGTIYQLNASDFGQTVATASCAANSIADNPSVRNGFVYKACTIDGVTNLVQYNASNIAQVISSFSKGYSSYAVSDEFVYFGSGTTFYQVNASNVSQVIANYTLAASATTVPVVNDDYVYVAGGNVMYQFDANNIGTLIGTYNVGSTIYGDPVVAKGFLYFGSANNNLYQLGTYNPVHSVEIDYPVDEGRYISVESLNYSVGGVGWEKCWYNLDGVTNSSVVDAGVDFGGLENASYWNNWSVYCNDSFGVVYNATSNFYVDVDWPELVLENLSFGVSEGVSAYIVASDGGGLDCFEVNDSDFSINCSGYLSNASSLDYGNYSLNISVNDSVGRISYGEFIVEITPNPVLGLEILIPSGNINVTQNEFFEVRARVSCLIADCGNVSLVLDPEEINKGLEIVAMSAVTLYDNKSFEYDVQDGCWMSDGQVDVFDGGLRMYVNGSEFGGLRNSFEDSNREAVCDWQTKSGLNVSRKVYVPSDQNWARYLEILNNSGDSEICVDVRVYQNMGSDGSDFINTSSGDSTWNSSDYWMMWDDSSSAGGDSAAGFVYQKNGTDEPVDIFTRSSGANEWTWQAVCVEPGQTKILMHFFTQWVSRILSETEAEFISENIADEIYFEGMSDLEKTAVVNWDVTSVKGGAISEIEGTTPFYTNGTNPYNFSLSFGESEVVSWFVNATGAVNESYEFFVYVNKSSMMEIGNVSERWNVTIVDFVVDNDAPTIVLNSPEDDVGSNGSVVMNYSVSDFSGVSNCSLYLDGVVNQTNDSLSLVYDYFELEDLDVGRYTWIVGCVDNSSNWGNSSERSFSVVLRSEFVGNSTDLSEVNISNITNLVVEVPSYGKINWSESVNLSGGADLDSYVNISFNRIEVDSSVLSSLNRSARLSFYGLSFNDPVILKDGVECGDNCSEILYSNGTLVFDVDSFSVYTSEENDSDEEVVVTSVSSGGGGRSRKVVEIENESECVSDLNCLEGYSCYEGACVKLFDVEVLELASSVEVLSFDLKYFVKGMAEINSDVILEFWLERDGKRVDLGKDTIYLGSFEEKIRETVLNLPYDLENGAYDLYVSSSFERYTAKSFRKVNIQIPLDIVQIESNQQRTEQVYVSVIVFLLAIVVLLAMKKTRVVIFRKAKRVRHRMKSKKMALHVEDVSEVKLTSENEEEGQSGGSSKKKVRKKLPRKSFGIREMYGKEVYGVSGHMVGWIEKVILSGGRIYGWVIRPSIKRDDGKLLFVRHDAVEDVGEVVLIGSVAEKRVFG